MTIKHLFITSILFFAFTVNADEKKQNVMCKMSTWKECAGSCEEYDTGFFPTTSPSVSISDTEWTAINFEGATARIIIDRYCDELYVSSIEVNDCLRVSISKGDTKNEAILSISANPQVLHFVLPVAKDGYGLTCVIQ